MNIYQMYHSNDCKFGFYVIRDSWRTVIGRITKIEGVKEGEKIKGKSPYYGNPTVYVELYKVFDNEDGLAEELCNSGHFIGEEILSCPGTYAYTLAN